MNIEHPVHFIVYTTFHFDQCKITTDKRIVRILGKAVDKLMDICRKTGRLLLQSFPRLQSVKQYQ